VLLPLALATAHDAAAAPWLLRLKAFGAGVVLSLAVVHLIKEALEAFTELTPGALCAACVRRPCAARHTLRCSAVGLLGVPSARAMRTRARRCACS
jgi:uncharacterized membrane protein